MLGSLAGNALFPTQLPGQFGPKLTDNQTTTSVVGAPVPMLFGTAALSGTFMWLDKIVEHQNTQSTGGKGGPEQSNTTYTYTQSVAVGLCGDLIAGMSRAWENGTLVYDIRPQADGESDADYSNRLTIAAAYADKFTLHLGGEDQTADATIEAVEGMGNVPGFRGLAYIVYPNRLLQEGQGLRHPSFRFEVFNTGVGDCTNETIYSNDVLYPWLAADDPTNPHNSNSFHIVAIDTHAPRYDAPANGNSYSTLAAAMAFANPQYDTTLDVVIGYSLPSDGGFESTSLVGGGSAAGGNGGIALGGQYITPDPHFVQLYFSFQGVNSGLHNAGVGAGDPQSVTPGDTYYVGGGFVQLTTSTVAVGGAPPPPASPYTFSKDNSGIGYPYVIDQIGCVVINVTREPSAPLPPCDGLPAFSGNPDFGVRDDGMLVRCGDWSYDTSQNYWVLQLYDGSLAGNNQAGGVVRYPLGPVVPQSQPLTEAQWTAAYDAAVANGSMAPGLSYASDGSGGYPKLKFDGAYTLAQQICSGAGGGVSLETIIKAICARCGLNDVDASDMRSVIVDGYAVASVSAGRDILTPLRSVGFFDCVESGSTLKFVARGKAIVASLTTDDFGAFDGSSTDTPGPAITTVKAQDEDLPLQTRVHYFATSRDYEDGEQLSPSRQTTTALNIVDVELAVCMDDSQAAQIAEVLWSDAWAERWGGTLAVDQAHSELEPGDCIEVPVDGVTRRIRIVNENTSSGVLRTLNYVRDDDTAYVSHAVVQAPLRKAQKLVLLSPTDLELLDLPALVDSDNDAGFYAAARGTTEDWNGAVIYKSADNGGTFGQLGSVTSPTTMGTINTAVSASDWHTWDDSTHIIVNVPAWMSFESRTDAAVLTGANTAAMGIDGRWELVQFANATQLSPTQWQLSRLLRGRRGTEHNIGSSVGGDKFIMISNGTLVRVPLQTSEIGASRIYKAVSIGTSYATGIDQTFTGRGMALEPFSPVHMTAQRESTEDILISWIRRGRLGRTLMSGVDIPLSEATESYSIDIYSNGSPRHIVRTLSSSVQHVSYTAADQIADFGTTGTGDNLTVAVYQLSATVGRGFPDLKTLTVS